MSIKKIQHDGFLTAEVLTGMAVLGLIVVGLTVSMSGFSAFNRYQWARQRCTAAAQAQMDSLTATGRPIEQETLQRLWPDVEVETQAQPGAPPWNGLEQVRVTARAQAGPRRVAVHLVRYIRSRPAVAKGGPR